MPNPVRAHRAPIRYSLKPFETRTIMRLAETNSGFTVSEIRGLARRYRSSTKPILRILETLNLDVLPERPDRPDRPPRRAPAKVSPRDAWRANVIRAEALFRPPDADAAEDDTEHADAGLVPPPREPGDAETTALAMIDELAAERAALQEREDRADRATDRARRELRRIARLRKETIAERDAAAAVAAERDRLAAEVSRLGAALADERTRDVSWRIGRMKLPDLRALLEDVIAEIARRLDGGRALRK